MVVIEQSIPSMVTVTVVPNPVPVIVSVSPPMLGAKAGETAVTTEVAACE